MIDNIKRGSFFTGRANRSGGASASAVLKGTWHVVARDKYGNIKWEDTLGHRDPITGEWVDHNLIVNQGLDHALDIVLSAGTQITTWYIALLGSSPSPVATWTYANTMSTANQEVTAYDEVNRVTWSDGGVSGQSVSNSASPATFTIDTNSTTVGGAALVSNNTKNDTAGGGAVMYAAGAFTAGNKLLDDNDTLDVTATYTAADDGA